MEREAFALAPNELSGIVQIGDKYVILLCEGHTSPIQVDMGEVRDLLYADLHEKKLRIAMDEAFARLHDAAQIDNYLTGTSQTPRAAKSAARPATQPTAPAAAAGRPTAPLRR